MILLVSQMDCALEIRENLSGKLTQMKENTNNLHQPGFDQENRTTLGVVRKNIH